MKRIIALAFGVCLIGGVAKAQTVESKYGVDSVKTIENASIYTEFVKQKNYTDALPAWWYVFNNAPKFQMSIYARGEEIMLGMFRKTKNYAYIDTLMMVYDQRMKYFGDDPKRGEGYILGRKGGNLAIFGKKDEQTQKEAYGYLVKSFELQGMNSDPKTVQIMFLTAGELLKNATIERDEYINLYMKVSDFIANELNSGRSPEKTAEMKANVDALFFNSGVADCETLDKMLTAKFNANQDDLDNLKSISSLLRRNECVDLPLYAAVAEKLYALDPAADAAYSLAIMFLRRQDYDKAENYLQEAIKKSEDNGAKADYYVRLAQLKLAKKQYAAVKSNALEALKINPNNGQALLLIGKAYAFYSPSYGADAFDHASVFWAAVDKFARAKQVDPGVAEEADKLISTYSPHFPNKEEAFFRSVTEGSAVKIGDWINETTKARFVK